MSRAGDPHPALRATFPPRGKGTPALSLWEREAAKRQGEGSLARPNVITRSLCRRPFGYSAASAGASCLCSSIRFALAPAARAESESWYNS